MSTAGAGDGDLCIVLHSHMPYVEGFGTWPFGEEWLLEAMAVSYVPLVRLLERRAAGGGEALLTVGITPVLADQLALPSVGERFVDFMRGVRPECHRLDSAGLDRDGQHAAAAALRAGALDYERAAEDFDAQGGDLLGALRRIADAGTVELWTSAASHPVLPLIATGQGAALQLQTGIAGHRRRFGPWTGGLWLPECAYRPGIEDALAAHGVRAFCVHQPARGDAFDRLEPVLTGAGATALPIDWGTIELVWGDRGYPRDGAYRDYHRQTHNGMRAWANGGDPYDAALAAARAAEHAREFVAAVAERLRRFRAQRGRRGLLVFAVDTELLGHWWYEGLWWLDGVLEEARRAGVGLATLPDALERHEPVSRPLAASTWGAGKDMRTWDSPAVAEYADLQRAAELRLVAALGGGPVPVAAYPAAQRAARELLALQASDWAFIRTRRLAGDYPDLRVRGHARAFDEAIGAVERAVRDFRAMPDPEPATARGEPAAAGRLRGLAPHLRIGALAGPPGSWGLSPERVAGSTAAPEPAEPATV